MTNKPFLYLDNWHARQPTSRFDRALATSGLDIEVYRTNQNEFPTGHNYCGAFISPSFDSAYDDISWVHRLHELLPELAGIDIPMIGLCFGCQVLASALVSRDTVSRRTEHEGGYGTIFLTTAAKTDPLCRNIPKVFDVFHWHSDEVCEDNDDILVLANGTGCNNHLWRWCKGHVWGVQPHPEMDANDLKDWLEHNRARIRMAGHNADDYLGYCFTSDPGFAILENFVRFVVDREALST